MTSVTSVTSPTSPPSTGRLSRRSLLEGTAALAAAAIPGGAHAAGSDALRIGLVGCGGRGVGAALQAVAADRGIVVAALGDLFADQLSAAAATLAAACGPAFAPRCLVHGAEAGERVIAADVDAVILATPPCFRPAEIAAAVRARRHVYAEAPVGIDAAGVHAAAAAVEAGRRAGLSLAAGLQSRHHAPLVSAVSTIAAGAVGRPRHGVAVHHLGLPWHRGDVRGTAAEKAIRNWVGVGRFSGGPLLEHHVHAFDRLHWALGEPTPLAAVALPTFGPLPPAPGRTPDVTVRITFAGGVTLDAAVVRREGIEDRIDEIVYGDTGTIDLRRAGGGGHAAGMAAFIRSLRDGPRRDDLGAACRATMLAVLARSAAAAGGATISWRDPQPAPPAGPA